MKNYNISVGPLTTDIKNAVMSDFAQDTNEKLGMKDLIGDPIAFQIYDNDLQLGTCVAQLF